VCFLLNKHRFFKKILRAMLNFNLNYSPFWSEVVSDWYYSIAKIAVFRERNKKYRQTNPDPNPDPLVRGMEPGIRIRTKMSQIPNTEEKSNYLLNWHPHSLRLRTRRFKRVPQLWRALRRPATQLGMRRICYHRI
jgi:hypothetical protein